RVRELKDRLVGDGVPLRESDAMRVTVDANPLGYSGHELAGLMRERGAECEMSGERYVVLLFSVVQPESNFARTAEILCGIPRKAPITPSEIPVIRPERVMSPREAFLSRRENVPTESAVGRICAGVYSPCPPCVPTVMPGERISVEAAEVMSRYGTKELLAVI
ncbi:MAG: hypothetical protein IK093_14665, partial [Ruminiclostridium sp.]|nr:hypothetical protein [Ruminiclostridium sp.]